MGCPRFPARSRSPASRRNGRPRCHRSAGCRAPLPGIHSCGFARGSRLPRPRTESACQHSGCARARRGRVPVGNSSCWEGRLVAGMFGIFGFEGGILRASQSAAIPFISSALTHFGRANCKIVHIFAANRKLPEASRRAIGANLREFPVPKQPSICCLMGACLEKSCFILGCRILGREFPRSVSSG